MNGGAGEHTPGPWTIGETQQGEIGIVADGVWIIAVKRGALYHPRGDANARLIAAAPELLHAAELALELTDCIQEEEGFSPSVSIPAAALRAAITKARGQ